MFFFVIKFQRTFTSRFLFLVLFLSFVLSKGIHSAPEPEICEFDQIEFALDSDLSNEVPKEPKKNLVFLPKENSFFKLGFIKESVWIRFNIKQYPRSRCFLRIPQVTLDGAALFAKSSVQVTGDRFRYSERSIDDYYPVFYLEPLDIQKGKNQYYLWIKTSSIINFPIFLESGLEYQKGNYYRNLLILFLLVLSLFIILLIGFIYRQTLDSVYLSIMGFLVFITLEGWVCFANGYKYLWPNVPEFQNITPTLFAFLTIACSVCFMFQFLLPSSLHKIFRVLLFGAMIISICLAILSSFILDRALAVKILSWTFVCVSVLVLGSTFSIIKSFSPARKIILCMIPIIGSGLITILYYLDLLKYNEYYVHAYLLSLPSIYIVITVSLRDREKFVKRKFLSRAYDIRQMQEKLNLPTQIPGMEFRNKLQFSLDHLLRVERIFKNPELNKKDFAEILRVAPNDLDRFVQEFSNLQSFEIYINRYRVEEAKHLLETRKDLKTSEIAHRSGFVSGREMEKSFKILTGMTSSEYKLMLFPDSI